MRTFSDKYKGVGGNYWSIHGREPSGSASDLPVFVWIMGSGDSVAAPVQDAWVTAMSRRGFVSAKIDYPNSVWNGFHGYFWNCVVLKLLTGSSLPCAQSIRPKGEKVYDAISAVCGRSRANCKDSGVAVAGFDQGGYMALYSVAFDSRITAVLPLGVGCGLFGTLPEELTNEEVSKRVPADKRVYVSGALDRMAGELRCNPGFSDRSDKLYQVPNGPHQFFSTCGDYATHGTKMKCEYMNSSEQWGLNMVCNWLSQAAAPAKGGTLTLEEESEDREDCEEQPITESPMCGRPPMEVMVAIFLAFCCPCCSCVACCVMCFSFFRHQSAALKVEDAELQEDVDTQLLKAAKAAGVGRDCCSTRQCFG